ncbi:hypothetical protein EVAR_97151_1 [Eumeta japonica]|uniref:Uncharacterized protein n=1 Tax=Eumeta variegata TaxID=151549 RepID=A0A4C1XSR3_EUMVA|nr:hypothetical protein EVAR_97151_1 [Eumeta japonica]
MHINYFSRGKLSRSRLHPRKMQSEVRLSKYYTLSAISFPIVGIAMVVNIRIGIGRPIEKCILDLTPAGAATVASLKGLKLKPPALARCRSGAAKKPSSPNVLDRRLNAFCEALNYDSI